MPKNRSTLFLSSQFIPVHVNVCFWRWGLLLIPSEHPTATVSQPHTFHTCPRTPKSHPFLLFFFYFPSFSILCLRTLPSPASLETLQASCFAEFFPLTSALGSGESGEVQIRKVEKERRDLDSGIPIDYSPPLS